MGRASTNLRNPAVWLLVALMAPFCLSHTFFLGLPSYVEPMARQLSFSDAEIGRIVFSHVTGLTLGTLLAAVAGALPRKSLGLAAIAANCLANLLPLYSVRLAVMIAGQAVAGFGVGILLALGMQQVARSAAPHRNLSVLITGQTVYTVLLVQLILPAVDSVWAIAGQFALISCLVLTCVPAVLLSGGSREALGSVVSSTSGARIQRRGGIGALFALFMFFMSVGVLWTFVERVGVEGGLGIGFITTVIAIANFASIPVCLAVPAMLARAGTLRVSTMAIAASCVSLLLLFLPLTPAVFATAVIGYLLSWALGSITLFTTVSLYDAGERLAAASPGCALFGAATGSLVGGMLATAVGYRVALEFSLGSCLLALLAYFWLSPTAMGELKTT